MPLGPAEVAKIAHLARLAIREEDVPAYAHSLSAILDLVEQMGEDELRRVLTQAEIGQFNERSWTYWRYRLGLARPDQTVPIPSKRRLG